MKGMKNGKKKLNHEKGIISQHNST